MIDQKQIANSNSEKKSRPDELKETGLKDQFGGKKNSLLSKFTDNIKINTNEHSFSDGKNHPSDFPSEGQGWNKPAMKGNTVFFEDTTKTAVSAFKNENFKAKKIDFYGVQEDFSEKNKNKHTSPIHEFQ